MAVSTGMAEGDGAPEVDVPVAAGTPEAVIRFLVESLVAAGKLPAAEQGPLVARLLRRETLGSTGVGRGLAIPHATSDGTDRLVLVVGRLPAPLDWSAIDGEPVRTVALVVGSGSNNAAGLRAIENVVRRLRSDGVK